jgi:hypothetical protein
MPRCVCCGCLDRPSRNCSFYKATIKDIHQSIPCNGYKPKETKKI